MFGCEDPHGFFNLAPVRIRLTARQLAGWVVGPAPHRGAIAPSRRKAPQNAWGLGRPRFQGARPGAPAGAAGAVECQPPVTPRHPGSAVTSATSQPRGRFFLYRVAIILYRAARN